MCKQKWDEPYLNQNIRVVSNNHGDSLDVVLYHCYFIVQHRFDDAQGELQTSIKDAS